MSQFSEKELSLMTAMVKNFSGSLLGSVNWDQVAIEAGYKDHKNAKIMGGRLLKKLTGGSAASAPAADGNNQDAGEGTSKAGATAAGKKRKAPGTAQGDASPVKAARPVKKPKATQAESSGVDKVATTKVKTEDHSSDSETEKLGKEDIRETLRA